MVTLNAPGYTKFTFTINSERFPKKLYKLELWNMPVSLTDMKITRELLDKSNYTENIVAMENIMS